MLNYQRVSNTILVRYHCNLFFFQSNNYSTSASKVPSMCVCIFWWFVQGCRYGCLDHQEMMLVGFERASRPSPLVLLWFWDMFPCFFFFGVYFVLFLFFFLSLSSVENIEMSPMKLGEFLRRGKGGGIAPLAFWALDSGPALGGATYEVIAI